MAKEKDLLLEFLEDYPDDAVDKALGMYKKMLPGITVTNIRGNKYFLKISSESNPRQSYEVSVTISKTKRTPIATARPWTGFGLLQTCGGSGDVPAYKSTRGEI